jgi:hypothetical protein
MAKILRDPPGPYHEKRGNALWVECHACRTWFPASSALQRPDAPPAVCPQCHAQIPLAAPRS